MKIGLVVQLFCCFSLVFAAKAPVTSAKSKLCGNDKCDEILFKAKVKRVMGSTHEAFLSLTEGALIDVTAVKFSDRTDLMEGVLADGSRGNFYIGAIDIGSYIEFLRNAIQQKKELKEISQDRNDVGAKKVLGAVRADLHLVRDYNVQARRYAEEQRLPEPELFPLSDPPSNDNSHGHSHGNSHGHSHGDSHGHNHGDSHGHSHGDGHGHSHGDSTGHSHGSDHTTHPHYVGHLHHNDLNGQLHEPIDSETKLAAATVVTESTATTSAPPPQPTNALPTIHKKENIPTPRTENQLHIPTPPVDQLHVSTPSVENHSHIPTPPVDQLHVSTPPVDNQHLSTPPVGQLHVSTPPVDNRPHIPTPPEVNQHLSTPTVGQLHVSTPTVDNHPHIPTPPVENQSPIPTPPVENQTHTSATPVENHSQTQINGTQLHISSTPISPVAEQLSAADVIVPTLQAEKLKTAEKLKIEQADSAVRDKREDTQGYTTVDSQEGGPTTDSNPVTLQPSTTLSPSDFDVHVSTSDTPVNFPDSAEFSSREKGSSDGDAVPLAGNQSPTEKEHHQSALEESKEFLNTINSGNSSNVVRELLKSLTGAIRTVSFMNAIDDAGIGFILNLSLLVAAVLFHCVSYFLSDINESSVCDTMIAHDLGTKCKLLDELNKSKDMEINRLGSVAGRSQGNIEEAAELRKEVCMKEAKIQNCLRTCENLKSELEEERRSRESLENNLEAERKQAVQVEECVADLRRRLFDSEQAYISATKELTAARQASEALERDLREERQSYEEVAADLKKAKDVAEKLRMDLQSANEEVKKLTSEKSNMELENATLSAMIEEAERIRKEGSGGSGGWSDFGDDIVEPVDEVRDSTTALPKVASPVTALGPVTDVRELTKLRVQLRKTEHELETVRVALENEKEERRRADSKLTSLETDLERRTKEVEERERDRSRADERCNELLALVKDGNIKVKETEQLRDKLWNDIAVLQSELASRAEDKRKKDEKISNLELELKRMRSEHLKLETRRFNEVLELKHKLDMMQTSQMQPLVPTTHGYDFLTKPERDDAPSPASLWEEAPRPMSCNRAATPEEDLLYGTFPAKKAHPRTRRSERAQLSNSPSDREKRKESHRRVRSRSHGRLWNGRSSDAIMRYLPMEPPYPHSFIPSEHMGYEMESSNHHRNRTVQVSSGGSNGGRSPPPEMPLLSAVPPPGLKKPAGKRIIDPEMEMKP